MNTADVRGAAGGHWSVGGIAEDNSVDLVRIVIVLLVGSWRAPKCGAGGTITAGAAGSEMCMSGVTQGIEYRGEPADGHNDSEKDGCGAERLAASDIEAGSGEYGEIAGQTLRPKWVALGLSRRGPGWRMSGEVAHTDSVDVLGYAALSRGDRPLLLNLFQQRPQNRHGCKAWRAGHQT